MDHRVKLKNVLSELTENQHLRHQYHKPIYEGFYINKRTTVLRELTKQHSYRDTCQGIKCKNHVVCGSVLPKWWFECKGRYLCTGCHMSFGTWKSGENTYVGKGVLDIIDNVECPICLEIQQCLLQPRCDHSLCIKCFKRCYFGDETREGEPIFPYSDIEDEYDDDPSHPKWENDYPLLKIYNKEWNKWNIERTTRHEKESFLRKCPICRK